MLLGKESLHILVSFLFLACGIFITTGKAYPQSPAHDSRSNSASTPEREVVENVFTIAGRLREKLIKHSLVNNNPSLQGIRGKVSLLKEGESPSEKEIAMSGERVSALLKVVNVIEHYIKKMDYFCLRGELRPALNPSSFKVRAILVDLLTHLDRGIREDQGETVFTWNASFIGMVTGGMADYIEQKIRQFNIAHEPSHFLPDDYYLLTSLELMEKWLIQAFGQNTAHQLSTQPKMQAIIEELKNADKIPCHFSDRDISPPRMDLKGLKVYQESTNGVLLPKDLKKDSFEAGSTMVFHFPVIDYEKGLDEFYDLKLRVESKTSDQDYKLDKSTYNPKSGIVEVRLPLNAWASPGIHLIDIIEFEDISGNELILEAERGEIDITFNVSSSKPDATPPQIMTDEITLFVENAEGQRRQLNTHERSNVKAGSTLIYYIPVSDDVSGIPEEEALRIFPKDSRDQLVSKFKATYQEDSKKFEVKIPIPKHASDTFLEIGEILVKDRANNINSIRPEYYPIKILALDPDTTAPKLDLANIKTFLMDKAGNSSPFPKPDNIEVTHGQMIMIEIPVSDDLSGVNALKPPYFMFNHESSTRSGKEALMAYGMFNPERGVIEIDIMIRKDVKPGRYDLNKIWGVHDNIGNEYTLMKPSGFHIEIKEKESK